jgi:hypothetical protein
LVPGLSDPRRRASLTETNRELNVLKCCGGR